MPKSNLKKRYGLSQAAIDHIFRGDPKDDDRFVGFHSEARKKIGGADVEIVQLSGPNKVLRDSNKPYKAKIKVKLDGKMRKQDNDMEKSFFPKNWLEADIIRYIEQALTNPDDSKRCSHEDWRINPRTIRTTGIVGAQQLATIRVKKIKCNIQYEGEKVISVYPAI